MRRSRLYRLTPEGYRLPSHVDEQGRLQAKAAANIPFLRWPDGSWCLSANCYMLELYRRGLSRRNDGGTLATYAAGLSHLLRFCWERRIDPIDLSNDQFTRFIKKLGRENRASDPEVAARTSNRVIDIGRVSLDFLASLSRHLDDEGFIGPNGRIRCERRQAKIKIEGGRGKKSHIVRNYWHHEAFPTPDPLKKRSPISSSLIARLRQVISEVSKTSHRRKRRYTMIKLLEVMGGRRSEVAAITVASVREAAAMEQPMLRVPTMKKRRDETRLVPIHSHDVRALLDYIEVNRARVIRKTIGVANDHGFLLVSGTTGKQLKPGTITREISLLAAHAGIEEKACPHMFRHRYITKIFVALIETHAFNTVDEFRKALLDGHTLKRKVKEWTGHSSVESLEQYIHLAFDEVADFKKTYNLVSTRLAVDSFCATVDETLEELMNVHRQGESSVLIIDRFAAKLRHFRSDLAIADQT